MLSDTGNHVLPEFPAKGVSGTAGRANDSSAGSIDLTDVYLTVFSDEW